MRIRFNTQNVRSHLSTLRDATTYTQRKAMNKRLAKLFAKAVVPMAGRTWREAQAAFVTGGVKAAEKVVAKAAR